MPRAARTRQTGVGPSVVTPSTVSTWRYTPRITPMAPHARSRSATPQTPPRQGTLTCSWHCFTFTARYRPRTTRADCEPLGHLQVTRYALRPAKGHSTRSTSVNGDRITNPITILAPPALSLLRIKWVVSTSAALRNVRICRDPCAGVVDTRRALGDQGPLVSRRTRL